MGRGSFVHVYVYSFKRKRKEQWPDARILFKVNIMMEAEKV